MPHTDSERSHRKRNRTNEAMFHPKLMRRIGGRNPRNDRANPCLGRTLRYDPEAEQVIGDDEANKLLRDGDRMYWAPCRSTLPKIESRSEVLKRNLRLDG
jgi:hypothetical protein